MHWCYFLFIVLIVLTAPENELLACLGGTTTYLSKRVDFNWLFGKTHKCEMVGKSYVSLYFLQKRRLTIKTGMLTSMLTLRNSSLTPKLTCYPEIREPRTCKLLTTPRSRVSKPGPSCCEATMLIQERYITSWHSLGGRDPFMPMTAAQWPKKLDFPAMKITWSPLLCDPSSMRTKDFAA